MKRLLLVSLLFVAICGALLYWQLAPDSRSREPAATSAELMESEYERLITDGPPLYPSKFERTFLAELGTSPDIVEFKRLFLLKLRKADHKVVENGLDRATSYTALSLVAQGKNAWDTFERALISAATLKPRYSEIKQILEEAEREDLNIEDALLGEVSLKLMRKMAQAVIFAGEADAIDPPYGGGFYLKHLPDLADLLVLFATYQFDNWIDDAHNAMSSLWRILTQTRRAPHAHLESYARASRALLRGVLKLTRSGDLPRNKLYEFVNPVDVWGSPSAGATNRLLDLRDSAVASIEIAESGDESTLDVELDSVFPSGPVTRLEDWIEQHVETVSSRVSELVSLVRALADRGDLLAPSTEWIRDNLELVRRHAEVIRPYFYAWLDDMYFVAVRARYEAMDPHGLGVRGSLESELGYRPHLQAMWDEDTVTMRILPDHPLREFIPEECLEAVLVLEPLD